MWFVLISYRDLLKICRNTHLKRKENLITHLEKKKKSMKQMTPRRSKELIILWKKAFSRLCQWDHRAKIWTKTDTLWYLHGCQYMCLHNYDVNGCCAQNWATLLFVYQLVPASYKVNDTSELHITEFFFFFFFLGGVHLSLVDSRHKGSVMREHFPVMMVIQAERLLWTFFHLHGCSLPPTHFHSPWHCLRADWDCAAVYLPQEHVMCRWTQTT